MIGKKLLSDHYNAFLQNVSDEGLIEVRVDRENVLRDIVQAIKYFYEQGKAQWGVRTNLDQRLFVLWGGDFQ